MNRSFGLMSIMAGAILAASNSVGASPKTHSPTSQSSQDEDIKKAEEKRKRRALRNQARKNKSHA